MVTAPLVTNTEGGSNNAFGSEALNVNVTGNNNSAFGDAALANNTGGNNSAFGAGALNTNAGGQRNVAVGFSALFANTSASNNVALGASALEAVTTGSGNIADGASAGSRLTTGINNIDIGHTGITGETKTIRLGKQGTQTKTFIAGIRGATVSGAAVVVNSAGQLGVQSSSRRFKENIQAMGEASARLLKLRPVIFRYKEADEQGNKPVQYGLIAEEVAKVFPELVVRNEAERIETVAYHTLSSLLLNEYQQAHAKSIIFEAEAKAQTAALAAQLADVRQAASARERELVAMQAELTALKQVTQLLMAARPSDSSVAQTGQ